MAAKKRLNREQKRAITEASLLEAARRVFGRRGYHGASLEEIADEAGFSKGALYYNFGGKEGLFLALLETRLGERVGLIRGAFESQGAAPEAVRAAARDYMESLPERREFFLLYLEFLAQAVREPKFRTYLVAELREAREGLADVIEEWGTELGVTSRHEAERLATAIHCLALGLSMEKSADPDGVPDDLFGEALARLFRDQEQDR
jgi:AcrR family transcriptional regulator